MSLFLNSDDFNFFTLEGWDFEKSKLKIKLSQKIDNFFFLYFFIYDYFCLHLPKKGPRNQFSKKKIDPL